MTVYQGLSLVLALLTLILASVNTLKAWKYLNAEVSKQTATNTPTADEEGKEALPAYSVYPQGQSNPNGSSKPTLLTAWNELPNTAVGAFWTYLMIPVLILGL